MYARIVIVPGDGKTERVLTKYLHMLLEDRYSLELKLLAAFLTSRGRVLSRQQLLEAAWGSATFVTDRAVDAHIVNLRRKIEADPKQPRYLQTVRGAGYMLSPD